MSLVLNVEILGEFKKLTAATTGAGKQLGNLDDTAKKISTGMNKAFAAIGIGLSFAAITNELKDMTKAAIEDRKSQELLANAMTNTTGATTAQIAAAEKAIGKLQIQAGVADDQLRPAYQKLFLATKDVTKSNDLLALALDVSAGTGKDLDAVAQAMAKSLAGSDTALLKLIPSLKGSKDPLDELAKSFDGAAEKAANTDPYQRMTIIFGEIQEKLGTALLPVLDDFAAWMSSPPGQATLQQIADAARNVLDELVATTKWIFANKDWLAPLAVGVGVLTGVTGAIRGVTTAIGLATAAQATFNATVSKNPWVIAATAAAIAGYGIYDYATNAEVARETATTVKKIDPMIPGAGAIGIGGSPTNNVTINVNNPGATAPDIIKKLDDYYKATGTRLR